MGVNHLSVDFNRISLQQSRSGQRFSKFDSHSAVFEIGVFAALEEIVCSHSNIERFVVGMLYKSYRISHIIVGSFYWKGERLGINHLAVNPCHRQVVHIVESCYRRPPVRLESLGFNAFVYVHEDCIAFVNILHSVSGYHTHCARCRACSHYRQLAYCLELFIVLCKQSVHALFPGIFKPFRSSKVLIVALCLQSRIDNVLSEGQRKGINNQIAALNQRHDVLLF